MSKCAAGGWTDAGSLPLTCVRFSLRNVENIYACFFTFILPTMLSGLTLRCDVVKVKTISPGIDCLHFRFSFYGTKYTVFCLRFMIFCQHKEQKMLHVITFMVVNGLGGQFSLEFGQRKQLKLCFLPYSSQRIY